MKVSPPTFISILEIKNWTINVQFFTTFIEVGSCTIHIVLVTERKNIDSGTTIIQTYLLLFIIGVCVKDKSLLVISSYIDITCLFWTKILFDTKSVII